MRNTKYIRWSSSSTMGRELSLWSQMISLASLRVVSLGAVMSLERGVMKSATLSVVSIRETR